MRQLDTLIIGGGVIGLSLAYELAKRGQRVQIVERGEMGREASWAGAGILPPANGTTAVHPYDQLRALSFDLHVEWAKQLEAESDVNNGFRRCGALYLARAAGEAAALRGLSNVLQAEQVAIERLSPEELVALEPGLSELCRRDQLKAAYYVPAECQIRNPRHLQALTIACERQGVEFLPRTSVQQFVTAGERIAGVLTSSGVLVAEQYCLTSGSWTQQLLQSLGVENSIFPIKGQMLLYACDRPPLTCVVNEGNRYLVPREDGHLLVGSTEEEVGFDKHNTDEGLADLQAFALDLLPGLATAKLEKSWAGLRPATFDGLPYLGRIPQWDNAFVAAGHFRSGLYLSPGTAVVMAQLLLGEQPQIDLDSFRIGRG